VQAGDTLFSISVRYGTTVDAFMYANNLTSDLIYEGQVLNVPAGDTVYPPAPVYDQTQPGYYHEGGYHVVTSGETLFSIAQRYGSSVDAVAGVNGLSYPYIIYEGQTLTIPAYGVNPAEGGYYPPQQDTAYPAPADGYYYQQPQDPTAYPAPGGLAGTHTVAPGETLFSIANRYGTSAQAIAVANGLANPNQIYVGQVLYLP
jgi:LysM repeat protein